MSDDEDLGITLTDGLEQFLEHEKKMQETVFVADDHIVINVTYEYNIPLDACRTYEKILGWAYHLTEKTWMTLDVQRYFIKIACRESGLEIPRL